MYRGSVIGYLLENIRARIPDLTPIMSDFDRTDSDFLMPQIPPLVFRKKWMEQIRYTVSQMHACGLNWSHAEPENIMIDMNDNAWIIPHSNSWDPGDDDDDDDDKEESESEEILAGIMKRAQDDDLVHLAELEERFLSDRSRLQLGCPMWAMYMYSACRARPIRSSSR